MSKKVEQIFDAYKKIKSKEFDYTLKSEYNYGEWDGVEKVYYYDIIKLLNSYHFDNMKDKESMQIGEDIKKISFYINFNNRYVFRVYILSFILLFVDIFLFYNQKISSINFYIMIGIVYFININIKSYIRKKIKKYEYINLS